MYVCVGAGEVPLLTFFFFEYKKVARESRKLEDLSKDRLVNSGKDQYEPQKTLRRCFFFNMHKMLQLQGVQEQKRDVRNSGEDR